MGTARRILSALLGAAISLLSSCSLGGGETDGVEVRLDPSRVAAAAREAVEGIAENEQVRVKVWAEFLCEYDSEKETREFTLFDRDLSHETFDVEFNKWLKGDLKDCSSFTIDGLPVGKTVTFTMSIHFKLSGAIDDEFTPYTSDPAKATIGVDRELTLTLRAKDDGEEDREEDEVVFVGDYTIKAAVPAELMESSPTVTYGSFFIWFQDEAGKWDWIELSDASSQSTISGGFIKYEGFLGKEIGIRQKMCVSANLVIRTGTTNYYSGISSEFTASKSGNLFSIDALSQVSDVPAPTHAILATLKFPTEAAGEECRCTMVFRRNSGDGVPLLTCQSSRTFKAESESEAEIHIDASELEEIGNTTAGIYADFYLHTGATKDDGLKYKLENRNIPFGLNRISKPGNIVLEKAE